jgi:hypothetical protein
MSEAINNRDKTRQPRRSAEVRKKERAQNFEKLAARRVTTIIEALRKLGNLANKGNYEYDPDDVEIIFKAIEGEKDRVKRLFRSTGDDIANFDLPAARMNYRRERK